MKFLRHFLAGYRLSFARFDHEQFGAPRPQARGCLASLLSNPRILIALLFVGGALAKYYLGTTTEQNTFTGRVQKLAAEMDTPEEEMAMGLASAPRMIQEFGGEHTDAEARAMVQRVGQRLVDSTKVRNTPYKFRFTLLRDPQTINAFALPGGQIFITAALFKALESEDQLAGVLGHEIGHVVGRHSTQQMAKSGLIQGLAQGAAVAMSDGHSNSGAQIAQMVGNMITMKYGREDEYESDALGVEFMIQSGYNPEAMIGVMDILKKASGGGSRPEITSTHPDPGNRAEHIREQIARYRQGK